MTIPDWPSLLVGISYYRPQRSSGNVPEYSFGRILWNRPWLTLAKIFLLFVNLQNEFDWGRDEVNKLCSHINWCSWLLLLTCTCAIDKSPIFPQVVEKIPVISCLSHLLMWKLCLKFIYHFNGTLYITCELIEYAVSFDICVWINIYLMLWANKPVFVIYKLFGTRIMFSLQSEGPSLGCIVAFVTWMLHKLCWLAKPLHKWLCNMFSCNWVLTWVTA